MVSSSGFESDSPALLTTRSTPPNASTAARNAATTGASSVTSTVTRDRDVRAAELARRRPPRCAASRSATTTQAPSAASRCAIALPMPDPAPVTSATRVASGLGFGIRASLASSSAQYSMRNFSASAIGAYVESASAPRITLIALT